VFASQLSSSDSGLTSAAWEFSHNKVINRLNKPDQITVDSSSIKIHFKSRLSEFEIIECDYSCTSPLSSMPLWTWMIIWLVRAHCKVNHKINNKQETHQEMR